MNTTTKTLPLAVAAALGVTALAPAPAAAGLIPNGQWVIEIVPTPTRTASYGATAFKIGKDGAWNSSFTFGSTPGTGSQGMTDNGTTLTTAGGARGSAVGGDGVAGKIIIDVNNNTFTVDSFNVDAIFATAGGTFVQYTDTTSAGSAQTTGLASMTGTIDGSGNITLDPTGRLGAISGGATPPYDERWNYDDSGSSALSSPAYDIFTTGTTTSGIAGQISGAAASAEGDINGDGIPDYSAILVSGGAVGSDWGPGFAGQSFYETWNVNIVSGVRAIADSYTVTAGATQSLSVLSNDTSGSGVTKTITAVTTPANGTATISGSSISYTNNGTVGADSFTYTIKGSDGTTSTATVNLNVVAAGSAIASNDIATTNQNEPVTIDVLANDTDQSGNTPPQGSITLSVPATSTQGGSLSVNSSNQVVYTPPSATFVGSDSFTYTYTDGSSTSNSATVSVTVNPAILSSLPSATVSPGSLAQSVGSTTGLLSASQVPTDPGVDQQCIGGCFDFKVSGVPAGGQISTVLLRLSQSIPVGARYRKYANGKWQDFNTSTGDSIASAPGGANSCPPPSDPSYQNGLNATDRCIRLTITDGGPNDSDATAGVIGDPGGVATGTGVTPTTTGPTDYKGLGDGGGCTMASTAKGPMQGGSWWLIGAGLAWLSVRKRRRQQ